MLDGEEGRHAATVRRLRVGEVVDVGDGAGQVLRASIRAVARGEVTLQVCSRREVARPECSITVVQALAKGDRGEQAVEAMTEAGVDAVVPWSAARSVVRWQGQRGEKSLRRWQRAAREATKQSRRGWVPDVSECASTDDVLGLAHRADAAYVLEASADEPLAGMPVPQRGSIVCVIGPEGGLDPAELAALREAGARAVRLGPSVLRTSTAGVAAIAVLSALGSRWN